MSNDPLQIPKEQLANSLLGLLQGYSSSHMSSKRMSKEQAYERLKKLTKEDFGYDIEAWKEYFDQHDYYTSFKGMPKYNLGKSKKDGEL